MKKLLFLLLAVILPMAVYAQLLDNNRMPNCWITIACSNVRPMRSRSLININS